MAEQAERPLPSDERVQVSTRDRDELSVRLCAWLAGVQGDPATTITAYEQPQANGMSSDTVLFDARWSGGGGAFVARLAPTDDAFPVFPTYDLIAQARVMRVDTQPGGADDRFGIAAVIDKFNVSRAAVDFALHKAEQAGVYKPPSAAATA